MTARVVAEIDTGQRRVSKLLKELHQAIGMVKAEHGAHLAGFALVAWDQRGMAFVATNTRQGPVSKHLAASYCAEQIGRLATCDDAEMGALKDFPPKGS